MPWAPSADEALPGWRARGTVRAPVGQRGLRARRLVAVVRVFEGLQRRPAIHEPPGYQATPWHWQALQRHGQVGTALQHSVLPGR